MEEYLRWLNLRYRALGRKVLLLLDNFSGHELGVQLCGGLQALSHVRVAWLPANTTSAWQPMDQGIIASFKCKYRRFWIDYMLRQIESDKNPNKTVSLPKAVQWTRSSWAAMSAETIQACWYKSTLIQRPLDVEMASDDIVADMAALEQQIQALSLPDLLPVSEFINPSYEIINDQDGDVFESVVSHYIRDIEDTIISDDDGPADVAALITAKEAFQALEVVQLWHLQPQRILQILINRVLIDLSVEFELNKPKPLFRAQLYPF